MRLAQLSAISNQPELIDRDAGELLDGMRAQVLGEVLGIKLGRAFGGFSAGQAGDALGAIVDGGKDGRAGSDALADERASGDDAAEGFGQGGAGAGIADEVVELRKKGGKGIVPGRMPFHHVTSGSVSG